MPRLTVVIPTFNQKRFLVEALDSVFAQTWKEFEVVVVDDGSTDDTEAAVRAYVDRFGLRYLHQANAGPAAARNRGIAAAQGEYVAFLDADDLWLPIKLSVQVPQMDARTDAVMAYSNFWHFDVDSGALELRYPPRKVRSGDLYHALIYKKLLCLPSTLIVRKEAAERAGGFNEELRIGEDKDFQIRVARHGPILGEPEALVIKRLHGAGNPKDAAALVPKEVVRAAQERALQEVLLGDPSLQSIARRIHAHYHLGWGLDCLAYREREKARREFWQSIRCNPFQVRAYLGFTRSLLR